MIQSGWDRPVIVGWLQESPRHFFDANGNMYALLKTSGKRPAYQIRVDGRLRRIYRSELTKDI